MSNLKSSLEPIRFGDFLREKNLITEEEWLAVLADHWANGGRIGEVVARHGYLSGHEIERQARHYHDLASIEIVV